MGTWVARLPKQRGREGAARSSGELKTPDSMVHLSPAAVLSMQ